MNRFGMFAVILAFSATSLLAQGRGRGKGHAKHGGGVYAGPSIGYYGDTDRLPPGLAKRGGNLPPGLQKHIERTGQLPPGLEKRRSGYYNGYGYYDQRNRDIFIDRDRDGIDDRDEHHVMRQDSRVWDRVYRNYDYRTRQHSYKRRFGKR